MALLKLISQIESFELLSSLLLIENKCKGFRLENLLQDSS